MSAHEVHAAAVRARGREVGHAGWPISVPAVLERVMVGLPVYWPTDPKLIDQAPYRAFAAERGPNSA